MDLDAGGTRTGMDHDAGGTRAAAEAGLLEALLPRTLPAGVLDLLVPTDAGGAASGAATGGVAVVDGLAIRLTPGTVMYAGWVRSMIPPRWR
eukprot:m.28534 g.28534  ORF g.28534 m.28534 type:complete len:92 (+) comp4563_c0_seq1:1192-1467(+)